VWQQVDGMSQHGELLVRFDPSVACRERRSSMVYSAGCLANVEFATHTSFFLFLNLRLGDDLLLDVAWYDIVV